MMKKLNILGGIAGILMVFPGGRAARAGVDDLPPLEPPAVAAPASSPLSAPSATPSPSPLQEPIPPEARDGRAHEALGGAGAVASPRQTIEKAPPAPPEERTEVEPPVPGARWISGYWDWDAARSDFTWVPGIWRVPPAGQFWVNGYWRRDDRGWSRVRGFWSGRKTAVPASGPPAERPAEQVGPAPGPDYFYVAGEYVPAGEGVTWRPGFWTKAQSGWDWVPARWVRLADRWSYREGHWERERSSAEHAVADANAPQRTTGARPFSSLGSPFRPAAGASSPGGLNETTELAPLPDPGLAAAPVTPPTPSGPPPAPPRSGPPLPGATGPRLPITDVFLPGGLHVQVVPGRLPWVGNTPMPPYPGIILPRVQVRPGPTPSEVRGMVSGLIRGVLP
jgi:hypothetical protein